MSKSKQLPALAALEGELIPRSGGGGPQAPTVRVAKLDTVRATARELARVYRAARRGELAPEIAARLAYVMSHLINALKVSELESRLDRLEENSRLKRLPGVGGDPDDDLARAQDETEAQDRAIIGDDSPTP